MKTQTLLNFIVIFMLWTIASIAQYVPKEKRNDQKSENTISKRLFNKFYTIKLKKKRQLTIKKPVVYCDSLIMEDESVIKVSPKLKSFTLYAQYVKIGKKCLITSKGKDGKNGTHTHINGEWGENAVDLNLYLNIYSLGNLSIDARGGNGGRGFVPGIYGAGGDVRFYYYSPLGVSIRKSSKRKRGKQSVYVQYKCGVMDLARLNELSTPDLAREVGKGRRRPRKVYDPVTGEIRTQMQSSTIQGHRFNRDFRNPQVLARESEEERQKRKKGSFGFERKSKPILPNEVKIK